MKIISHPIETPNKDIEIVKKNNVEILESKSTITNIKKICKAQYQIWVGGRTIELNNRSTEIIQSEERNEKVRKMNRASETCETCKSINTHNTNPKGERRVKGVEIIFKETWLKHIKFEEKHLSIHLRSSISSKINYETFNLDKT